MKWFIMWVVGCLLVILFSTPLDALIVLLPIGLIVLMIADAVWQHRRWVRRQRNRR